MSTKYPGMKGDAGRGLMPGMHRKEQRPRSSDTGDAQLPTSRGKDALTIDRSGVRPMARDKHGTPSGLDARFNKLPPGMEISDQEVSAASGQKIPFKRWSGIGRDGRLNDESVWKTEDQV